MKIFTTLCCAALTICSAIHAQSPIDHIKVHFNAPVMVGETKLPAGECDIQVMHGVSDNIILVMRSDEGSTTAAVASRIFTGEQDTDATSVVLKHKGSDLQVYRIMVSGNTGYQLISAE